MAQICIEENLAFTYSFLLVCIIALVIYANQPHIQHRNLDLDLNKKIKELEIRLDQRDQRDRGGGVTTKFLDKIYNPLTPPENVYPGGNYDGYRRYQEIGYLTSEQGQFPVFARYKYAGKTDRFEYYTITDSRNRIKIPFNIKNFNELYDGDQVTIPELGTFSFKKYPDEGLRYDPNTV